MTVDSASPAPGSTKANDAAGPRNPVLTANGEVRASKLIGASVYNDRNQKIGTVDDVLVSKENTATAVVVSVGGFLGIGSKLVQVPYERLQFNETMANTTARIIMPGATRNALISMPTYHYASTR